MNSLPLVALGISLSLLLVLSCAVLFIADKHMLVSRSEEFMLALFSFRRRKEGVVGDAAVWGIGRGGGGGGKGVGTYY